MRQLPVISLLAASACLAGAAYAEHLELEGSTVVSEQQVDVTAPTTAEASQ